MMWVLRAILFLSMSLLVACANPTPTPPPLGLEPTFALGPTFVLTPAPDPGRLIFSTKGVRGFGGVLTGPGVGLQGQCAQPDAKGLCYIWNPPHYSLSEKQNRCSN